MASNCEDAFIAGGEKAGNKAARMLARIIARGILKIQEGDPEAAEFAGRYLANYDIIYLCKACTNLPKVTFAITTTGDIFKEVAIKSGLNENKISAQALLAVREGSDHFFYREDRWGTEVMFAYNAGWWASAAVLKRGEEDYGDFTVFLAEDIVDAD